MRERLFGVPKKNHCKRITPARAGKTFVLEKLPVVGWDHPRSCGKDQANGYTARVNEGSPPLVRERLEAGRRARKPGRITPARAGKTGKLHRRIRRSQDHPRSCGKDTADVLQFAFLPGSPPLVRERRFGAKIRNSFMGITPARAGKTAMIIAFEASCKDHPRSCGKDSNGSLYLRHFALAGIQNLFNFFAGYLSTKKHKARFVKI